MKGRGPKIGVACVVCHPYFRYLFLEGVILMLWTYGVGVAVGYAGQGAISDGPI
jgi:hypothetical protein